MLDITEALLVRTLTSIADSLKARRHRPHIGYSRQQGNAVPIDSTG